MNADPRSKFASWLEYMPEALDTWRRQLPPDLAPSLDYSLESLSRLEAWMLETYPTRASAAAESETDRIDGCARYLGEVYRTLYGGRWDIYLDDPRNILYGVPHMKGFVRGGPPIIPLDLAHNAVDRRTGAYFRFIASGLEPVDDEDDER